MHAFVELAEHRRQDLVADAARERLAKQARPAQPFAPQTRAILWSAVQTASAAARVARDAIFVRRLGTGSTKREQSLLTAAH